MTSLNKTMNIRDYKGLDKLGNAQTPQNVFRNLSIRIIFCLQRALSILKDGNMYSDTQKIPATSSFPGPWTINWAAIFASLVFIYALSWLLFTLSSAIGLSIVDIPNPHDDYVKSESLTISITLYAWLIGTILITYFAGGWLVGRFSGNTDQRIVSLHGLVVWSCTIIIAVILGAMGVNSVLSSAAGAVKTTATVGMNLPQQITLNKEQLPSSFQPLIASLKQGIRSNSEQGSTDSQEKRSSDEMDPQAMSLIVSALVQGDEKQAKELIASNTALNEKQVDELINSVKTKAKELSQDIEAKANEVRQYASGILWLVFISYIVALFASIFGARYGAKESSLVMAAV